MNVAASGGMKAACLIDSQKVERLYQQAARQQWAAEVELDFSKEVDLDPLAKQVWGELATVFYTLEKMGLEVLCRMFVSASHQLHSEATLRYLTLQCADEGRHVAILEKYLAKLGYPVHYDQRLHILSQAASWGPCRVENWLFSTLFSENFASSFLRRAKAAHIDTFGSEMCRRILIDESRHIHFLNIVLPDVLDRMSLFKRSYVKLSQRFILNFSEKMSRQFAPAASEVGIDRRELLEEVFENVAKTYESFGATRDFIHFPTIH